MDATASAVALILVVLLIAWLLLARMISNRKEEARLKVLLSPIEPPSATAGSSEPAIQRPVTIVPQTNVSKPLRPVGGEFVPRVAGHPTLSVWQELPVVFAAALRGRAM